MRDRNDLNRYMRDPSSHMINFCPLGWFYLNLNKLMINKNANSVLVKIYNSITAACPFILESL